MSALGALRRFAQSVRADHEAQSTLDRRYGATGGQVRGSSLASDVVQRVGMQMMFSIRLMRLAGELGVPLAPKIASRMIRFVYGSDVHWDAEIGNGLTLVHGMGLAISGSAKIGERCLVFHNVTLGEAIHPATREVGAPHVGDDVHIGPGATLLGPITIGKGSKIMAGAVVTESVPEGSLVRTASSTIVPRKQRKAERGGDERDGDGR
jgi:serine O-acetyltransferase